MANASTGELQHLQPLEVLCAANQSSITDALEGRMGGQVAVSETTHAVSEKPKPALLARRDGEEIEELWQAFKRHGDRCARERLVYLYYPLVKHVARTVAPSLARAVSIDDLEGYGAEGLIDAADRYDPDRGVQFSTFAVPRIRGAIYDGIRASDWVPRRIRQKARAIEEAQAELSAFHGRTPTEAEEAAALGISVEALRTGKAQVVGANLPALDPHRAEQFSHGLSATEPLSHWLEQETREAVRSAMRRMPERERAVALMSFAEGMTLAEIGRSLGVTESRVCQIRTNALKRLRGFMSAAGMGPELAEVGGRRAS